MLSKNRRLDKKTFNSVYNKGENINSNIGYFKVSHLNGNTRIACVATKKSTQKSVDRTKIRRRGYGVVEKHLKDIPDGYGIIWFLPDKTLQAGAEELDKSVKKMILSLNGV